MEESGLHDIGSPPPTPAGQDPMWSQIDTGDPRTWFIGLKLREIGTDSIVTLKSRKEDDSGWWLEEGGGISDAVFRATGNWEVAAAVPIGDEGPDAEITDIGFDPGDMDAEEIERMAQLMHDSNEARVAALEEKAGPNNQGSLENAFDALRMLVFIEQIAFKLEISPLCNLDFEGRRAKMLTGIETKYAQMLAAREAAERAQRLAGGPGPGMPPPGSGPRPMPRQR